jgi:glutamate--cysteine ligase catalytic subunit
VDAYLDTLEIDLDNMTKIQSYLDLVRRRSNGMQNLFILILTDVCMGIGTLLTPATWIRNFVQSHPDYQKDSVVSQVINYDLLVAVDEM